MRSGNTGGARLLGYALLSVLVLLTIEALSFVFFTIVREAGMARTLSRIYTPPSVSADQFREYVKDRHPILGWPSSAGLDSTADDLGSRISPANHALAQAGVCLSLYGDSFTYSADVGHAEAWSNLVARDLGCRVLNYGVGGYGVDQAVMRFELNETDDAPITILGLFLQDLNRNMTRWNYLLWGATPLSFKPRYKIEDGHLLFVPLPVHSYRDFREVAASPHLLRDEGYLPGRNNLRSQVIVRFPYSLSLVRLAARLTSEINPEKVSLRRPASEWNYPIWYDDESGPSDDKIQLNNRIVEQFSDLCHAKGRRCVVLLIPNNDQVRSFGSTPTLGSEALGFAEHVEVWDPTEFFSRETAEKGICFYIGQKRNCHGHYNADGYALLAEYVVGRLRSTSWLAPPMGDTTHALPNLAGSE